jgi:hypothetical protein
VPAEFCGPTDSFVYQFAIGTWERQTTAIVPGEIDVDLDVNDDGTPDFNIFSGPASIPGLGDARAVTWVYDYAAETLDGWWYTEHGTNDSNTILTICAEQLGLDATAFGSPWAFDVTAYDWYYRDYAVTDRIEGIEVAPYGEHFYGLVDTIDGDIPALSIADLYALDVSGSYAYPANPSETGIMVVTNAYSAVGDFRGGAPRGRESILLTVMEP